MKYWHALSLNVALLLDCASAQKPDLQPEVTVMLRSDPVEQLRLRSDAASAKQNMLDSYGFARDRLVNKVLKKHGAQMRPLFEGTSGTKDLKLAKWWTVTQPAALASTNITDVLEELRLQPDVEMAYSADPPTLAAVIPPVDLSDKGGPSTPDYTSQQTYFLPAAAGGFDINFAHNQPGGVGTGVNVFDIEYDWNTAHEDLQTQGPYTIGDRYNPMGKAYFRAHGTAVAGIIGGDANSFGIKGIAPNATFYGIGVIVNGSVNIPRAIQIAVDRGRPGDVILLEQQRNWVVSTESNAPERYLPMEWWPAEFAAIQSATSLGFIVIEASGNGLIDGRLSGIAPNGQNLDDPLLALSRNPGGLRTPNPFNSSNPSSGAILVGAGASRDALMDRSRMDYSTYGARVDVQGWGQNVASTGAVVNNTGYTFYCNLNKIGTTDTNRCYTSTFSGTSSASALVAGIAASVQGYLKAQRRSPLTPAQFIQLLRDPGTGDSQRNGDALHPASQRIGSRPDLARLLPKALKMSSPIPAQNGSDTDPYQ